MPPAPKRRRIETPPPTASPTVRVASAGVGLAAGSSVRKKKTPAAAGLNKRGQADDAGGAAAHRLAGEASVQGAASGAGGGTRKEKEKEEDDRAEVVGSADSDSSTLGDSADETDEAGDRADGVDGSTSGDSSQEDNAPDETQGDDPPPQADTVHLDYLRTTILPFVQRHLAGGDKDRLVDIWFMYSRYEALCASGHWTPPDESEKLRKSGEWESRSFANVMLGETVIQAGSEKREIQWAGVALIYLLATSDGLRKAFTTILACKSDAELKTWSLDLEDVQSEKAMADAKGSCLYVLSRAGYGLYVGQTATTGREREKLHRSVPVSLTMEAAREGSDFDLDWARRVVWEPPVAERSRFSNMVLLLLEHIIIMATKATSDSNLNTKMFDNASWQSVANAAAIDTFVTAVLDEIAPRDRKGIRNPTGILVNREFFRVRHARYHSITGLGSGSHSSIMRGGSWGWRVRAFVLEVRDAASMWASGRLPPSLAPTGAERRRRAAEAKIERAKAKARKGKDEEKAVRRRRMKELNKLTTDRDRAAKNGARTRGGATPAVLNGQAAETWADSMPWGS